MRWIERWDSLSGKPVVVDHQDTGHDRASTFPGFRSRWLPPREGEVGPPVPLPGALVLAQHEGPLLPVADNCSIGSAAPKIETRPPVLPAPVVSWTAARYSR